MLIGVLQRVIRWMPLVLLIMLFMVDRDNNFHKIGYIGLLLTYTSILIIRILYARERWHDEFSVQNIANDPEIEKMSDYRDKLENIYDSDQETNK